MKNVVLSVLALLCSSALVSAKTANQTVEEQISAKAFPASQVSVTRWDALRHTHLTELIRPGMSEKKVKALLGEPQKVLGTDVVSYDNCAPDQAAAAKCRELVIAYSGGRVESLLFVNAPMSTQIAQAASKPKLNPASLPTAVAVNAPKQ